MKKCFLNYQYKDQHYRMSKLMKTIPQYTFIQSSKASKYLSKSLIEVIINKTFYSLELTINFMADPKINFPYPV